MPRNPRSGNAESEDHPPPTRATWLHVTRIVVSGLFMIGQNKDFEAGAPVIGPARLIIGALIGFAILIGALLLLVSAITK